MNARWIALGIAVVTAIGLGWLGPRLAQPPDRFSVAMDLMSEDRADEALHLLDDPSWRGVAQYRAGRYQRALVDFIADETADNLYNLGNAYARLHEWRGAKSAYRKALSLAPDHDDARHNLGVVERAEQAEKELIEAQRSTRRAGRWRDGDREDEPQDGPEGGTKIEQGENTDGDLEATDKRSADAGQSDQPGRLGDEALSDRSQAGRAGGDATEDPGTDLTGASGMAIVMTESAQEAEILLRAIEDNPARVLHARLHAIDKARRAEEGR